MNNREFYKKWGNTATLKTLISTIFIIGMETVWDSPTALYMETFEDATFQKIPAPGNMIQLAECFRDFKAMPDGFQKNVIKKVL